MKTWPGWRIRKARSSKAFGLIGSSLAVAQQPVAAEVGLDRPEIDDRRRPVDRDRLLGPAEQRPDPRRQLAQAERLGHVVVGAELEPDHLVQLGILGREHHDRHARLGADDPADLDPRQLGEHQVEQDEVGTFGPEPGQGLATVGRRDDPESVGLERVDQRLAQGRLVVDDEDRSCHSRLSIRARVNDPLTRRSAIGLEALREFHVVLDEVDAAAVGVEAQRSSGCSRGRAASRRRWCTGSPPITLARSASTAYGRYHAVQVPGSSRFSSQSATIASRPTTGSSSQG